MYVYVTTSLFIYFYDTVTQYHILSNMDRLPPIVHNDVELFNSQLLGALGELTFVEQKLFVTKAYLEDVFELAKKKPLNNSEDAREKTIALLCDIVDDHFYSFLDDLKVISDRASTLQANVKHLNLALFQLTKKFRECRKSTLEEFNIEISSTMEAVNPIELTNRVLQASSAFPTVEQMELIDMKSLDTGSEGEKETTGMSVDSDVTHDEDDSSEETSAYDTVTKMFDNIPDLNKLTLSQKQTQRTLDDFFLCSTKKK